MLHKILTLGILTAAALAGQTVDGRVVNAATGNGIPNVSIGLLAMGQTSYRTTTDATGRFQIEGVNDGSYTPYYQAADFGPSRDGAAPAIQVKAGAGPVHLEYAMTPMIKISGRVLDAAGNPVPKASLELMQVSGSNTILMPAAANDKGEYSARSTWPGAWIVSATAPSSWKPPEPRDGQRLGWARTFYPSVTDPALAVKIDVPPGGEAASVDIKLAVAPVYRIRGVLLDVQGDPVPKATVELSTAGLVAMLRSPGPHQDTGEDGAFEFEAVSAGEVRLSSTVTQDGVKQWAGGSVEIKDRDLEDVKLQLTLPFSLQEKVVMDVPEGSTAPKAPIVVAMSAEARGGAFDAVPDGKGGYAIRNLYPGLYQFDAMTSPAPYYLDSIRLGGVDVPPSGVQIQSGAEPVVLTYKRNGGTVRGTVEGCGDGLVFLVPQDPSQRNFNFIHSTKCGQNGRFEIPDVRPGEYYGLAVGQDSPVPASPTDLDQNLINQSTRVSVRANEATDAEIRLIKRQ